MTPLIMLAAGVFVAWMWAKNQHDNAVRQFKARCRKEDKEAYGAWLERIHEESDQCIEYLHGKRDSMPPPVPTFYFRKEERQ